MVIRGAVGGGPARVLCLLLLDVVKEGVECVSALTVCTHRVHDCVVVELVATTDGGKVRSEGRREGGREREK